MAPEKYKHKKYSDIRNVKNLKTSWVGWVTSIHVLQRMNQESELINTIKKRKLKYLGCIMRVQKFTLLRNIMQSKSKGKRSVGRRQISWLRNLREC